MINIVEPAMIIDSGNIIDDQKSLVQDSLYTHNWTTKISHLWELMGYWFLYPVLCCTLQSFPYKFFILPQLPHLAMVKTLYTGQDQNKIWRD